MIPPRLLRRCGLFVLCLSMLLGWGCARGLIKKGPTGQDEKGIGLKIPVLDFARKESYDAENLSADNLKEEELNPFRKTPSSSTSGSSESR